MTTRFIRFTQRAQADAGLRFTSLMGLLFEPEGLQESFQRQAGNKAPGVPRLAVKASNWEPDGVTLQVRFCEGGATYRFAGIRAATLPMP